MVVLTQAYVQSPNHLKSRYYYMIHVVVCECCIHDHCEIDERFLTVERELQCLGPQVIYESDNH